MKCLLIRVYIAFLIWAAILLRHACVEYALRLKEKISAEERNRRLDTAGSKLDQAFRAFEFDERHRKIIEGHLILLRITCNHEDEDGKIQEDAAKIGQWDLLVQNEQISWFVGMMILAFGRKQMLKYNQNEIAYRCFRCVRACFSDLEYRFGVMQALQWEVYTLMAIHDQASAKKISGLLTEEFRACLKDFDNIAAATADQARGISVAPLKNIMITNYSYLISEVYYQTGEVQRGDEGMAQLRDGNIPKNFLISLQN